MASNSPGAYSLPHTGSSNQDILMISGLLPEVDSTLGKFQMDLGSSFQRDISFIGRDSGYYVNTSDGASTCSSSTTETCEPDSGSLLVLEPKSLRSFTTNDEYLFAMKEDLADWFSNLYQNYDITADNIFQVLETGVLLCKHANKVQEFARQSREMGETLEMRSYFIRSVPEGNVQYREGVKPETFQARDNVSNFITWTRDLGIPQVLGFETDDLVLRKNEKSVILCLLEVARVGAKLGMLAPTLIQMEQEIDAELAGEECPPQIQIKTCDLRSLDERVRDLISRCTCPVQFPMVKVSDGKYQIGDSRSLIFVRILRSHVMVRVGGGWDTLENYLNKHDPCQCNYKGHRAGTARAAHKNATNQQRRSSIPNQTPPFPFSNTATPARQASPASASSRNRSTSPQTFFRPDSPHTPVIPYNIPAPNKHGASTGTSAKGTRAVPSQNQQGMATEAWSLPSASLANNSSSSQPIRPDSPSLAHLKSLSPFRTSQSASQHTLSSSGVIKGKDGFQGNRINTTRKDSLKSYDRSSSFDEQADLYSMIQISPSSLEGTWESELNFAKGNVTVNTGLDRTNVVPLAELKHHSFLKEQKYGTCQHQAGISSRKSKTSPTQILNENPLKDKPIPVQDPIPLKDAIRQSNTKGIVGSGIETGGFPQFPEQERETSPALGMKKTRAQTASQSSTNTARILVSSHPKMLAPYSPTKTPTSSGSGQKTLSALEKATSKETKTPNSSHGKIDAVTKVAHDVSVWLESTNEIDLPGISSTSTISPTKTQTLGESSTNMPQKLTHMNDEDKQIEAFDIVPKPQVQLPISAIRVRPITASRIPKPRYDSHPSTPKASTSVSVDSPKGNIGSSNSLSSNASNISQIDNNTVSEIAQLVLSKSNSNSSLRSLDEFPLSPDSSFSKDESIKSAKSSNQTKEFTRASGKLSLPSNNNSGHNSRVVFVSKKTVTPVSDARNLAVKTQMAGTYDKLGKGKFSGTGINNSAPNNQRRSSVHTIAQTNTLFAPDHGSSLRRTSSSSNLEPDSQVMFTNDITFSDDEEINELIKNSGLKEKESNRNLNSSRKVLHHKDKDNEEIFMINRDRSGQHAVQLQKKKDVKYDSTPKSTKSGLKHRTYSSTTFADYSSSDKAISRPTSQTPEPIMFRKKKSPVGSAMAKRQPRTQPKQVKDLGNEVLATDQSSNAILTETNQGFIHVDNKILDHPQNDLQMYKNMEKLYEKYREIEQMASVTETCVGRTVAAPSDMPSDT